MTHPFEGYQILDTKLGGMGMVLEGLDPRLDRKVAIKMWISDDEKARAGALEEAKTLAKLDHVNIVKVYDTGEWNGRVYFVMEWVEGANGAEWIDDEDKAHDWRTVRDVYVAAGRGLAHAHRKGIAHRDFKPSNILVGDEPGVVKVADFGIADRLRSSTPEVRPTKVGGSRSYMAPERLDGLDGDARADQFSFCVALWEALFDQPPYLGLTPMGLLAAIEAHEILPCDPLADVPHWLSRVVRKGLHPDPAQRYPSMEALVDALTDDPPPGDPSEGGVDESELFETEGYINAPASESAVAELAELEPEPLSVDDDENVGNEPADAPNDSAVAELDAGGTSDATPVELPPSRERQYSKRELVRVSITTGVTVAFTMAGVLMLVRPRAERVATSLSPSWVSTVATVANATVDETASLLKKSELNDAYQAWMMRARGTEGTETSRIDDAVSMVGFFLRESQALESLGSTQRSQGGTLR